MLLKTCTLLKMVLSFNRIEVLGEGGMFEVAVLLARNRFANLSDGVIDGFFIGSHEYSHRREECANGEEICHGVHLEKLCKDLYR